MCIRLLLPALYPDDVCLISDMDMMPMQREYFIDSVKDVHEDQFVIYRTHCLHPPKEEYPMCYVAGKGILYQDIFNIKSINEIPVIVKKWFQQQRGKQLHKIISTDQQMLFESVNKWEHFYSNCTLLDVPVHRIDRKDHLKYDSELFKKNYYTDLHSLRPYKLYAKIIDPIVKKAIVLAEKRKNHIIFLKN